MIFFLLILLPQYKRLSPGINILACVRTVYVCVCVWGGGGGGAVDLKNSDINYIAITLLFVENLWLEPKPILTTKATHQNGHCPSVPRPAKQPWNGLLEL